MLSEETEPGAAVGSGSDEAESWGAGVDDGHGGEAAGVDTDTDGG